MTQTWTLTKLYESRKILCPTWSIYLQWHYWVSFSSLLVKLCIFVSQSEQKKCQQVYKTFSNTDFLRNVHMLLNVNQLKITKHVHSKLIVVILTKLHNRHKGENDQMMTKRWDWLNTACAKSSRNAAEPLQLIRYDRHTITLFIWCRFLWYWIDSLNFLMYFILIIFFQVIKMHIISFTFGVQLKAAVQTWACNSYIKLY